MVLWACLGDWRVTSNTPQIIPLQTQQQKPPSEQRVASTDKNSGLSLLSAASTHQVELVYLCFIVLLLLLDLRTHSSLILCTHCRPSSTNHPPRNRWPPQMGFYCHQLPQPTRWNMCLSISVLVWVCVLMVTWP